MEIKPTYVTFQQAKLLKEKGFNNPCRFCITQEGDIPLPFDTGNTIHLNSLHPYYSAPEQWQIIEWFWETYLIDVSVIPFREKGNKSIGFQYRVINFSDCEVDEVIFEHQYNRSSQVFTTKKEVYSAAFDYILNKLI